jgi:NAD(P)H-quinone oxidoreductase subunit 5
LVATAVARVQSDIKSALAFASLSQVGIIVVEISAGLTTLAFVHIIGHACFRLLQFLSAPNLLHDLHDIENRSGHHGLKRSTWPRFAPGQRWFLFALERAFVDSLLDRVATAPFSRLVSHLDSFDRALCGQRRAAKADDTKAVR